MIEAEAQIPMAMADAFRSGNSGCHGLLQVAQHPSRTPKCVIQYAKPPEKPSSNPGGSGRNKNENLEFKNDSRFFYDLEPALIIAEESSRWVKRGATYQAAVYIRL